MIKKDKIPLIIALSIPFLMTLLISLSIYLPTIGVHPKMDFLYCYADNYASNRYIIRNNQLIEQEVKYPSPDSVGHQEVKLFIYDVQRNTSKEIAFEAAKRLVLDPRSKSPDGFEVTSGSGSGYSMFPFFYSYSDYNDKYLRKGNYSKKLEMNTHESYYSGYYRQPYFIGWVIKGE